MMQCAANYMMANPRGRCDVGMAGGSVFDRCFIESDACSISACDEDSAFTFVEFPRWLQRWCAAPPLFAHEVWHLLSPELRSSISDPFTVRVAPQYTRLAMGSSHSVYIIMRIDIEHVGRSLYEYSKCLRARTASPETQINSDSSAQVDAHPRDNLSHELSIEADACDDYFWETKQQQRRSSLAVASGSSVDEWAASVRAAKLASVRVMVVLHFFRRERPR